MTALTPQHKTFLLGLSVSVIVLVSFFGGAIADRLFVIKPLDALLARKSTVATSTTNTSTLGGLLTPTSSVADVAEAASKSVVTVSIKKQLKLLSQLRFKLN